MCLICFLFLGVSIQSFSLVFCEGKFHPLELILHLSSPFNQNYYKEANKNSMATSYSLPSDTPLIKQVKLNSTVTSNVSLPACDNTNNTCYLE